MVSEPAKVDGNQMDFSRKCSLFFPVLVDSLDAKPSRYQAATLAWMCDINMDSLMASEEAFVPPASYEHPSLAGIGFNIHSEIIKWLFLFLKSMKRSNTFCSWLG